MQKVLQYLRSLRPDGPTLGTAPFTATHFLKNHLSSEDSVYLR